MTGGFAGSVPRSDDVDWPRNQPSPGRNSRSRAGGLPQPSVHDGAASPWTEGARGERRLQRSTAASVRRARRALRALAPGREERKRRRAAGLSACRPSVPSCEGSQLERPSDENPNIEHEQQWVLCTCSLPPRPCRRHRAATSRAALTSWRSMMGEHAAVLIGDRPTSRCAGPAKTSAAPTIHTTGISWRVCAPRFRTIAGL